MKMTAANTIRVSDAKQLYREEVQNCLRLRHANAVLSMEEEVVIAESFDLCLRSDTCALMLISGRNVHPDEHRLLLDGQVNTIVSRALLIGVSLGCIAIGLLVFGALWLHQEYR